MGKGRGTRLKERQCVSSMQIEPYQNCWAEMGMPKCLKINPTRKCSRVELTNEQQQCATVLLAW